MLCLEVRVITEARFNLSGGDLEDKMPITAKMV